MTDRGCPGTDSGYDRGCFRQQRFSLDAKCLILLLYILHIYSGQEMTGDSKVNGLYEGYYIHI
jgi:hypothetical protein